MSATRRVVITGTSSGIGYATARLLVEKGYLVFAGVRKNTDFDRLAAEGSERLIPLELDITDPEQIAQAARQLDALADSGLYALVNNAGTAVVGPLELMAMKDLRRQFEVNFFGHVALTQALLPLIRRGNGRIVNVTSSNGRFAFPMLGAYCASKFAMEGLTDSLRRELRPWGIAVIAVEPGTVEAPIWDHDESQVETVLDRLKPEGRDLYGPHLQNLNDMMQKGRSCAASPSLLAETIYRALEARRPRARYQKGPGSSMSGIGGCLPDWLTDWLVEKILQKKLSTRFLGW